MICSLQWHAMAVVALLGIVSDSHRDFAPALLLTSSVYRHFLHESARKRLPIHGHCASDDSFANGIGESYAIGALAARRCVEARPRVPKAPLS